MVFTTVIALMKDVPDIEGDISEKINSFSVMPVAILCGDWLLARAVISLCETRNQKTIHEMGKAIAAARWKEDEFLIADVIIQHGETVRGS